MASSSIGQGTSQAGQDGHCGEDWAGTWLKDE